MGPTVMGALRIYLLIGLLFAYFEQFRGAVGSGPFFAEYGDGTPSDSIYFSYVTLTTVGYGDLTVAGNLGRAPAVVEAMIGQLYFVTVVGFTVGNVAGRRRR
jgi:Ion channel